MTGSGLHILYIDDDPALGKLVQRQLVRLGYTVDVATSGPEGIGKISTTPYDAVALDHYMPGQDGLQTLAEIRAMPDPPPVVYCTGTQEGRVAVAALTQGAADYVIKELDNDFVELLRSALEGAAEKVSLRKAREAAEAEVRAARDRFEALARERALLLREMNHRVANSLQMILSLLRVQASTHRHGEVQDALQIASARVSAVARVHRRLYTTEHVDRVAADQYLLSLLSDLQESAHRGEDKPVLVSLVSDSIELDADRATALGMAVSELVINASKYAYPEGEGPIRCGMVREGPAIHVVVEDDGVGLPADTREGLGSMIVRAMVQKLGGTLQRLPKDTGTRVQITFPEIVAQNVVDVAAEG